MSDLLCSVKLGAMTLVLPLSATSLSALAPMTPDCIHLIFNESDKSINMTLRNNGPKPPYLAQSWIEGEKGDKITSSLTVLPLVRRTDSMINRQVKVQGMPDISKLPAGRGSVFYFNVREISPESNEPSTLQAVPQTHIKSLWRSKALERVSMKSPQQHRVILIHSGQAFTVNNPVPYCVIINSASVQKSGNPVAGFLPLVIGPRTTVPLNVKMDGVSVLTYVNGFGARMPLFFRYSDNGCQVNEEQGHKD